MDAGGCWENAIVGGCTTVAVAAFAGVVAGAAEEAVIVMVLPPEGAEVGAL